MANNEKNYFDLLPNEIKIYILSYLNTSDVVNLSTLSSWEHLTCEKSLIGKISFYKTAKCEMFSFLTNENRRELITSLNITGVYWVPPDQLINGVRQLVNLKCLYAIDTQFEYNAKHLKVFKSLRQLSALSITARQAKSATAKLPNQIIKFYLSSHRRQILQRILNSICKSSNVKDLWFIEYSLTYPRYVQNFDLSQVSNLERFVCWSYPCNYGFREHTINGMKLVFQSRLTSLHSQLIFEKDMGEFSQEIYKSWTFDDITWKKYFRKTCLRPFGFKDVKTLMTGLISPSELQYTELNLKHHNTFCSNHRSIVQSLLMCKNMKMLKKLSISFCLCKRESLMRQPLSKYNRKRMRFSSLKSKFDDIVFNCPLIEELEIWECNSNVYGDVINGDCFRCIRELKNLKKLSLFQFPHSVRGSTLFTLCSKLPNLTSLRIHSFEPNSTLALGVAKSLEYSPMLKYLRYESGNIDLDVFFNFVCTLPNLKLETLVLFCRTQTFLNRNQSLDKFLSRNKQLRFLLIKVNCSSVKTSLENIITNYKTDWHAYFVKTLDDNLNDMVILTIDNLEMVSNVPMISVLHPFDHFIID